MGNYDERRRGIMAWQSTLGAMREHGTIVILTGCRCRHQDVNLTDLIDQRGPEASLWDDQPECPVCKDRRHYMASAGQATPFRPLITPDVVRARLEAERKAFLKSFGFTRRDMIRIKAMAESTTANYSPAALNDLDVAVRVGACMPGGERHTTGAWLGSWAGRSLLYWTINSGEREIWAKRRREPRGV